ncbi:MAG: bifunctional DNA-formamidopyrimidine glycosylase/DNA-(apurinic or apyrimidinic site) lyase [Anaplasmataceae bacterium]|nr:bifunctional DNA-formamidopyrimidine glycosylase/DNA-(apurinic or apyrimidinic site) lyase [Anaplasmataceae bacterium]
MPELPEVETIRRDLLSVIFKKQIVRVDFLGMTRVFPEAALFRRRVQKLSVKDIRRVGKLLIFDLEKYQMMVHLKMTGQLVLKTRTDVISGGHPVKGLMELPNKFTRAIFYFKSGEELYFNDMRKFGYIKLVSPEEARKIIAPYGVDPLTNDFSQDFWRAVTKKYGRSIVKHFLLRQTPISGLGNIYVDEACFRAKIRPTRLLGSLTPKEQGDLYKGIRRVLELSIANRGTSFNTYRGADGAKGVFYKFLHVYGRNKEKCRKCKTPIVKVRVAGRGTHYCPTCQV